MRYMIFFFIFIQIPLVYCLDNGLGKTPPMGWNSWNKFGCHINETVIKKAADQIINLGLKQKGYKYINLDDCWQISRNQTTGQILPDHNKFPSGFQNLIDYIHEKGLLFGLYSDAGALTCQGRPGGYMHQQDDANTYAKWGVDYLKYDNCHNQHLDVKLRYRRMQLALNATGKPIYFSMCEWGYQKPWTWAQNFSNSWRTTIDIKDLWESMILNLQQQVGLAKYAGPGAWNDPDMLQVGNGGMSTDQYQSHFALWALLKAPLLIGCDLDNISKQTLDILSNEQIISINQDRLGKQGDRISKQIHLDGYKQIWGSEMSQNRFAIVFFNRSPIKARFQYDFSKNQQYNGMKIVKIRNAIEHTDVDIPQDKVLKSSQIRKHACEVYIVSLAPLNLMYYQ